MKNNESTRIIGNNVILVPYRDKHVLRYHEWMKSQELQELTASEPLTLEEEYNMQRSWREDEDKCTFIVLSKSIFEDTSSEVDSMIGDTNLFFINSDPNCAEIEIMIADKSNQGKGFGREATILMMRYGVEKLNINKYLAKISMGNTKSISLFTKLGFEKVSTSEIFKEVCLEKCVDYKFYEWLVSETLNAIRDENYK